MPVPADLEKELELQGIAPGSYDFTPLDGLRKLIARRMTESVQAAPHFSINMKVEMDAVLDLRERLKLQKGLRISVNDFIIKASAMALMRCREANVSFTTKGIISHHHADVAFAVAMNGGLVTPIVRNAELKSVEDIATETRDLSARGRSKKLLPDEYSGGTFTVSNLGMFGVSSFGAIINQPQSCILSVGTAQRAYVFRDDKPYAAMVLEATLTCDHRIVDGATGAKWLQQFKTLIELPEKELGV